MKKREEKGKRGVILVLWSGVSNAKIDRRVLKYDFGGKLGTRSRHVRSIYLYYHMMMI